MTPDQMKKRIVRLEDALRLLLGVPRDEYARIHARKVLGERDEFPLPDDPKQMSFAMLFRSGREMV